MFIKPCVSQLEGNYDYDELVPAIAAFKKLSKLRIHYCELVYSYFKQHNFS